MWEFIQKLSLNRGINIVLMIFGNVIAPYWFIFQVMPNVYEHTELPKLIMLSLCIGTPISLINYVLVFSAGPNTGERQEQLNQELGNIEEKKKEQQFSVMAFLSFITALILYITTWRLSDLQESNTAANLNIYAFHYIAFYDVLIIALLSFLRYRANKKKKDTTPT